MSRRSQMPFPAASCPMSHGLSGMDRRQTTSKTGAENGPTDAANAHSTAIHPQHTPPIVQRPALPFVKSHEDSSVDLGHNVDLFAYSPGDNSFVNVFSHDEFVSKLLQQQDWMTPISEDFISDLMFTSGTHYDPCLEEVMADSESTFHEAPESEAASYAVISNTASPKRKREAPLTEEQKKERNREYSKRYREKQSLKTQARDAELDQAHNIVGVLKGYVRSLMAELQRRVRYENELKLENRSLRNQLTDQQQDLFHPFYPARETKDGNFETRESFLSDDQCVGLEYSSACPLSSEGFQPSFQS